MTEIRRIQPQGPFDVAQSIDFGFGQKAAETGAHVLRMAFVVDGYRAAAGMAVRQPTGPDGEVLVEIEGAGPGEADPERVTAQVARILSLDHDAAGWVELGRRDALMGRLQAARPGLRPPLFHSAYEAAAWSVLSARRPRQQMAALRDRFAAAHGTAFGLDGQIRHAFPTPEQLLAVPAFEGLPEIKLRRLHGVARAAADGRLDTAALRALEPDVAGAAVQTLEGIGPTYAALVVIRALGHADVLPRQEPLVRAVLAELEGRTEVTPDDLERIAADWRPWRTWAAVHVRAAGPRLLPPDSVVARRSVSK